MDEKMKVIENAVRQYILYGIAIFERNMPTSIVTGKQIGRAHV